MRRRLLAPLGLVLSVAAGAGCVGTTGGQLYDFPAAAAGPADAPAGAPLAFTNSLGWHVVLTQAVLHVGAIYLNESRPASGAQATSCILDPSTYVAQVAPSAAGGALDVDLLSPAPQRFSVPGQGTSATALLGQVWLTGGDINATADATPILTVTGTAENAGGPVIPFTGRITIGSNHQASGAVAAGGDPICKERIVPVAASLHVQPEGGLLLRIDPRLLFVKVDFSELAPDGAGGYAFSDDPTSPSYAPASAQLYQNLHSGGALYTFSWSTDL